MRVNNSSQGSYGQPANISDCEIQKRLARHGDVNMMMKGPGGYKTVDVSDDIRDSIIDFTRNEFVNNFGMSDGEDFWKLVKGYAANVSSEERSDFTHTLSQISTDEVYRLTKLVRQINPGWQAGKAFDRETVSKLIANSMDISV